MEIEAHMCCVLGSGHPTLVHTVALTSWLKMSRKFTPKCEALEFPYLEQGITHPDLRLMLVEGII